MLKTTRGNIGTRESESPPLRQSRIAVMSSYYHAIIHSFIQRYNSVRLDYAITNRGTIRTCFICDSLFKFGINYSNPRKIEKIFHLSMFVLIFDK